MGFYREDGCRRGVRTGSSGAVGITVTSAPQPPLSTDTVARAASKKELRVEATSTNAAATLRVYVAPTNALIGILRNNGGGKYSGQFAYAITPQSITVRSSAGGSATRAVTLE